MSHTLCSDFTVESEKGPIYWWPLIFEAMRWQSFSFTAEGQPKGMGYYYFIRSGESFEQGPVSFEASPFKMVWDEIYLEIGEVLVSFWSSGSNSFDLGVSVRQDKQNGLVHIGMVFQGGNIMGLSEEEARERLRVVLDCTKVLYQVCQPSTGEIYWEFAGVSYAPCASFGMLPGASFLERPKIPDEHGQFITYMLPDGSRFYLLEPMPIPGRGGGWNFISLV